MFATEVPLTDSDYLDNNFHLYLFNQKEALRNKRYEEALFNAVVAADEVAPFHISISV